MPVPAGSGSVFIMGLLNNFLPHSLIVWGQTQPPAVSVHPECNHTVFTVLLAHFLTHDERLVFRKIWACCSASPSLFPDAAGIAAGFGLRSWADGGNLFIHTLFSQAFSANGSGNAAFGERHRNVNCSSLTMLPVIMLVDSPRTLGSRLCHGWRFSGCP